MTYADRLRAAREREGLTQREASNRIGVHKTTVTKWETGRTTPSSRHAYALWKLLGVVPGEGVPPEPEELPEPGEPFRVDMPDDPSDQRVVEEAARCCIAVAKSEGAYHGTTADDLVTSHVGEDMSRWKRMMTRVRNRARELEAKVFDSKERTLGEESA